ncbi:Thermophilic metalloprotease (M29) [uncultured Clostridium sp.]|uniref:Aminopeptidase n=1 Tax=Flintibacter hominis TaxID=2763048 RepID=A0A8J6J3I4_9FIRM|nr:aminopeptidase [Flintibacter hominis]MBC5723634.1 aminopeptidase [Flintibacter hominis]SCH82337.1 Thermophilic metalloprotease (M29) [uncultured Clostridium sp.]
MELVEIGKNILTSCMNVRPKEQVLVVTDDEKYAIGQALYQAAKVLGSEAMLMTMSPRAVSGQEPPAAVAAAMKAADVVLCPMSTSITHTRAKIEAAAAGARIATMPGITKDMFTKGAMTADYRRVMEFTERVAELLTKASTARIEKQGRVMTLDLRGRPGVSSPGIYREKGQAGNLPSGEAYIAPVETGANGSMVIDGSVVGIGLLKEPLEVEVKNGVLQSIRGKEAEKLDILLKSRNNATLCELGIGTNYAAGLVGIILEDEKAYQTVHIAFGTNVGFGGNNQADCHIDGIIKNPTLYLDDKLVMLDGVFQI